MSTADLPMVARFQRDRWTPERIAIDAMEVGAVLTFDKSQYFNVKSSVQRLNSAYDKTRFWLLETHNLASTVTRTK